jgi:hypothetical protein
LEELSRLRLPCGERQAIQALGQTLRHEFGNEAEEGLKEAKKRARMPEPKAR